MLFIFVPEGMRKDILNLTQTLSQEQANKVVLSESTELLIVKRVVDGDTIVVTKEGKNETVRLIGINTPETVDPRKPVECFGKEAKTYLASFVDGKRVRLEADPTQQDHDKYGRMLRYIFLEDGTFVNKVMIQNGYAYEYTYDIPYEYQAEFKNAENGARDTKTGLWSPTTCAGAQ